MRAIRDIMVSVIPHGIRTNKHLSFETQKAALEKIAKEKGISVAELVRRIIDKELDRGKKQKKGESLVAVAGAGCGRTPRLRESKVVLCDGYTCGFGGHGVKNPGFILPTVPDGCVRHSCGGCFLVDTTLASQQRKK